MSSSRDTYAELEGSQVKTVAERYQPTWLPRAQVLGRRASRLMLDVDVSGLEHVSLTGALIVAGNHTGFLDGPLVTAWTPRPIRTLTKVEIFSGLPGRVLVRLGQISLDRDIPDRNALHAACEELTAGGACGVFPEGTRGDGELLEIKDGIGYLAVRSGAPIVPVAVIGTQQAMPKGAKLPRRGHPVHVAFGPAFTPDLSGDPYARRTSARVAEEVRGRLREHLEAVRRDLDLVRTGD